MKTIPFYANPDDTHCFQAVLRMILESDFPDRQFGWTELDNLTRRKANKWTWPSSGLLVMKELDYEVLVRQSFDYQEFVKHGREYLHEFYGSEAAELQISNSDIDYEIENARSLISQVDVCGSEPSIVDISNLIEEGYWVVCNVNQNVLNQEVGYTGHFVLVLNVNEQELVINDPGLPAIKKRSVSFDRFMSAWAFPTASAKNIYALKLF